MRRRGIGPEPSPEEEAAAAAAGAFLDLERLARVELTSEDPEHPIESALVPGAGPGWRAEGPRRQTIRLVFDEPQRIRRVRLEFEEGGRERTQEFALSWTSADGETDRFLVRQQYTFRPGGATREVEDGAFDVEGVTALDVDIVPDVGGGATRDSLVSLRIARAGAGPPEHSPRGPGVRSVFHARRPEPQGAGGRPDPGFIRRGIRTSRARARRLGPPAGRGGWHSGRDADRYLSP